jgi:hypothetical protein
LDVLFLSLFCSSEFSPTNSESFDCKHFKTA